MNTATELPAQESPFRLSPGNHPADILDGAASVARFIADLSPNLTEHGGGCGLSDP